jgi:hypothetical protein
MQLCGSYCLKLRGGYPIFINILIKNNEKIKNQFLLFIKKEQK